MLVFCWVKFLWMVPFDVVLNLLHSFTQSMDINGNYIPLVFILLPGKSEELYSCAFSSLLHVCSENGLAFAPSVVHVDFEWTVMKLIENIFPSADMLSFPPWSILVEEDPISGT